MKVVTSGYTYLDIDGYGGCIAYAELLRTQGQKATAASNATLNESITQTVRGWGGELRQGYTAQPDDEFVLVDLSNPDFFDTFVRQDAVSEIIDHHPGFEVYWQDQLGDKAVIEFIGAACTLVYEKFKSAGMASRITQTSARLLMTGILDNTLNFKAHVTTQRDKDAYKALSQFADLPEDWPAQYFSECQQAISRDLEKAIRNDVKSMKEFAKLPDWIGQLVIWDAAALLQDQADHMIRTMEDIAGVKAWAMNIVSIGEGKSYFLTKDVSTQKSLGALLDLQFSGNIAVANRLWLRKEIMKASLQA